MKNLVKTSFILLALVSILFTSCRKEYEIPPIYSVPFGDTLTIGDILAMPAKTTFDTASVCGIITADEKSGNLYKTVFIQDRSTGQAIELRLSSSSAARIGDSVRVCLDPSLMYNPYHNLPQITDKNGNGFNPDGHLLIYPYNNPIKPKTVTIADIKAGGYIASLVKIDSVEFVEKNVPFCEVGETTNRHVVDATSPNSDDNFIVRTSNYANFAYDYMPISKGSFVGIASIYNSTYQILLRSKTEMNFAVWGTPSAPAGGVQSMPYIQSFESAFGTYTTYNVEGNQVWAIEYSSAKITGHEGGAGGTDYANEDWLISSPVDVSGVSHAKAVINYAACYTAPLDGDLTVQVSSDYEFGKDPQTATWTELPVRFANNSTSSSWNFADQEADLDQFIGQTVSVAMKFISTTSGSRTIEIKSITIMEGEAGGVTPPSPGTGSGSGTQDDPYNVAAGISLQGQGSGWVSGYIVGAVKSGPSSVSSNDDIDWAAPFTRATNVLIADDANCHEVSNCIIIELGSTAMKPIVNLVDNPGNLGKQLSVNGTLRTYFGQSGLRDCPGTENDFILEGGTPPTPPTTEYFNQTLTTQGSFDTFTTYSVEGEQVWHFDSAHANYGAQMSGFANNTSYANEDWIVSPAIDLSGSIAPVLTFDHTRGPAGSINVGVAEGYYTVWATNNYTGGDPTQVQWTELTGVNHATEAWKWVSSGNVSIPAEFRTPTCRIALKYLSIDGASATWEVKNIVVKEQ